MGRKKTVRFDFLQHEAAGGVVLCLAAVAAMIIANSALAGAYENLLHAHVGIGIAPLALEKSVSHWINDGLMVIFFFLVGLEIKRELLAGALSSFKTASLPLIAAAGGMVAPALFYATVNWQDSIALRGWAIPAATDIAFAVGVMAILGSRVPPALKVFLLALAIIDDIGAILIIALFYTSELSFEALLLAALGLLVLFAMNRTGIKRIAPYVVMGILVWLCVLKSGVHATLAGVLTALAIPLEASVTGEKGPLERLEHAISPWVSFGILPVFALANAGVSLAGVSLASLAAPVSLGIAGGLLLGKPVGIYLTAILAVRSGLSAMPEETTRAQLLGAGVLAGIGFTMSLFIGMLAFPDAAHAVPVRLGVMAGSILSAVLGYAILSRCNRA